MNRLFIVMLLLFAAAMVYAQAPSASVREMTGTVEIKRQNAAEWSAARVGERIERDTVVSTGFRSTAILTVGESTLVVRPLTRLSLQELVNLNETETVSVNLNTGRVRVEVKPPAGRTASFTVTSPSATASVRGTTFEMDPASIQVIEGAVSYAPAAATAAAGRAVTVSANQESFVDTDSGKAAVPMEAAQVARSLPVLPGQAASGTESGSSREPARYSLGLEIDLIPKR